MNCPQCFTPNTKTLEVRRTQKSGLRRRLVCCACGERFTVHGGVTAGELDRARTTLREKGYLQ